MTQILLTIKLVYPTFKVSKFLVKLELCLN